MVIKIEMPKLSDTMSEGKILAWKKSVGDKVRAGEVIAEIESDKANMEMEAVDPGYLRKILIPAGSSAPVGTLIAVFTETASEEIPELAAGGQNGTKTSSGGHGQESPKIAATRTEATAKPQTSSPAAIAATLATSASSTATAVATRGPSARGSARIVASPLASRMAAELNLDLTSIRGSGPEGRIVKRDILEAAKNKPAAAARAGAAPEARSEKKQEGALYRAPALSALPGQAYEDVPVSSMRRIIGTRLVESKAQAPHFYLTVEVDMKQAIRAREQLNSITGVNVTYNDFVVKAVALCLGRHPGLNASWQTDFIRYYKSIDIGVAVALPDGLITPIVRACQLKSLGMISQEVKELAEKAKAKRLTPDEFKGGTFTVSNLGMFGVKHFTAIINPPEACILAVSAIQEVPVVENGAVVPGHRMSLTLSSDHRVVDGALAAQFMRDLKQAIESPVSLAL